MKQLLNREHIRRAVLITALSSISALIFTTFQNASLQRKSPLYIQITLIREGKAEEAYTILKGSQLRDFLNLLQDKKIECPDKCTRELKNGNRIFLSKKGKLSVVEKKPLC